MADVDVTVVDDDGRVLRQEPTPRVLCWVDVSTLFPAPPDADRYAKQGDELDLSSPVPGVLHRWLRGHGGHWIGDVSYVIGHLDPNARPTRVDRQLVDARHLRRRDSSD